MIWHKAVLVACIALFLATFASSELIEDFSKLPCLNPQTQTLQASTYDLSGGNDDGFNGTYTCKGTDERGDCIIFDEEGPGIIKRFWLTRADIASTPVKEKLEDIGNLKFYFDEAPEPSMEIRVQDFFCTVADATVSPRPPPRTDCQAPFQRPLVADDLDTQGGYYSYVPIPFKLHLKITIPSGLSGNLFYNITSEKYPTDTEMISFTGSENLSKLISLFNSAGTNPNPATLLSTDSISLAPSETATIFESNQPGTIAGMQFGLASDLGTAAMSNLFLKIRWNGEATPSVNAPLSAIFNSSIQYNELGFKGIAFGTMSSGDSLYLYFPMPYSQSAKVEITNQGSGEIDKFEYEISYQNGAPNLGCSEFGNFKIEYGNKNGLDGDGEDVVLLEKTGTGKIVGTAVSVKSDKSAVLEGDEKIFVDGSSSPQIHGTGTEDYFNGGWYWNGIWKTTLMSGVPFVDLLQGFEAYRLHLQDPINYSSNVKFTIEHGSQSMTPLDSYESAVFYYEKEPPVSPATETNCTDGTDNDSDGMIDCADPDCSANPACALPPTPEICNNSADDDGDSLIDCADPECSADPACALPPTPVPEPQKLRIIDFTLSPSSTLTIGTMATNITAKVSVLNNTPDNAVLKINFYKAGETSTLLSESRNTIQPRPTPSEVAYTLQGSTLGTFDTGNYVLKARLELADGTYVDSFERSIIIVKREQAAVPELPLPLVFLTFAGVLALLYFKNSKH